PVAELRQATVASTSKSTSFSQTPRSLSSFSDSSVSSSSTRNRSMSASGSRVASGATACWCTRCTRSTIVASCWPMSSRLSQAAFALAVARPQDEPIDLRELAAVSLGELGDDRLARLHGGEPPRLAERRVDAPAERVEAGQHREQHGFAGHPGEEHRDAPVDE